MESDLTRLAMQHLDKHQWQLPLMEMDKKFLDRTYYKHYTSSYKSSLQSKLGRFLTDNKAHKNEPTKTLLVSSCNQQTNDSPIKQASNKLVAASNSELKGSAVASTSQKKQNQKQNQNQKHKLYAPLKISEPRRVASESANKQAKARAISDAWATFKRKAAETVKEYEELSRGSKARINLVVVGHVDAGKSTLVGHLLFGLGQISSKQMHRLEVDSQRAGKSSFKYAWAMDETIEERARGVTIDIALSQFETPNRQVAILDAPGHVDFIPAVISGAAQADAALLVIDATRGEFETGFALGGQTREHTYLARSLGVKSVIVAINKMDNVEWHWNRFNEIVDQLRSFLKAAGFSGPEQVQFVACSGLTGENLLDKRIDALKRQSSHPQLEGDGGDWASVPTLVEAIDRLRPPQRPVEQPSRACVTDVYKGVSGGVSLGAKLVSGKLEPKQKLLLLPARESCELKQIEIEASKAERAFAGDIVTLAVIGVDMAKFYRGSILCDPLSPCQVTNRFEARIITFQSASSVLVEGSPVEVHMNGSFESATVRRLMSLLDKTTGALVQRRPRCVPRNSSAVVRLKLERAVCCELYETSKELGKFMVRSLGNTIAAGLVTRIKPANVAKRAKSKMIQLK